MPLTGSQVSTVDPRPCCRAVWGPRCGFLAETFNAEMELSKCLVVFEDSTCSLDYSSFVRHIK